MRAVPLEIDDEVYAQAEQKAQAMSTSISVLVGDYLRHWVQNHDAQLLACEQMRQRFANPDWEFAVGKLESREERNARR
ncbi:MAG: hypothetical protein WD872_07200 [Pirellulaceae bacterium]